MLTKYSVIIQTPIETNPSTYRSNNRVPSFSCTIQCAYLVAMISQRLLTDTKVSQRLQKSFLNKLHVAREVVSKLLETFCVSDIRSILK